MKNERYIMSLTTGGLFLRKSVKLATLYLEQGDWNALRDKVLSENLLQTRTVSTSKRFCWEIISRLKTLGPREMDLLVHGTDREQGYLLWIAVCRRYKFIADFAVEIIRERYLSLKTDLRYEDFDSYFNRKSEWHPELDELKPTTRNKLRQVLFKILREAGLLTNRYTLDAAMLSPRLLDAISHSSREAVLFFPAVQSDLIGRAR